MQAFLSRTLPALLLAFAFAQGGEFAQQYRQRLGGAADALRSVVERFDAGAAAEGLSRGEAIARLEANADPIAVRQGSGAAETVRRFAETERRYRALSAASDLARPLAILSDPDWDVLRRTAEDFAPAVPAGPAGLLLTFFGFVLGWGAGAVAEGSARLYGRRRAARRARRRREAEAPAAAVAPPFDHRPPIL